MMECHLLVMPVTRITASVTHEQTRTANGLLLSCTTRPITSICNVPLDSNLGHHIMLD